MNKNKLAKVSLVLQTLFMINLILLPIMHLFYWWVPKNDQLNKMISMEIGPLHIDAALLHSLSPITHFGVFCIATLPVLAEMYLMYLLMSLFRQYAKGEVFSFTAINIITRIGYTLLALPLIGRLSDLANSYLLTLDSPKHYLVFGITSYDLQSIVTGFLVIIISWIMREAKRLHEEQQLTI